MDPLTRECRTTCLAPARAARGGQGCLKTSFKKDMVGQQRVQGRLVKGHKTSRGERLWEMSLEEAPGLQ